jgi:hypothetical protein
MIKPVSHEIYNSSRESRSTPLPYYDIIVEGKGKESNFFVYNFYYLAIAGL